MAQTERIPPHNMDAEKSVLGAILIDKEVFFKVSEFVRADDFYSPAHKEIFNAMVDLYANSEPIDVVTVSDRLRRRKSLEAAGGRLYVSKLAEAVPTTANAVQYAKIVAEKAVLRRLISAAGDIVEKSFAENLDSTKVLDHAEQTIYEIAKTRQTTDFTDIKEAMSQTIEQIREVQANGGELPGVSTGFRDLDRITTGLHKSDLVIVAARPSMGKTALVLNIMQNAAIKQHKRTVLFSLEMNKVSLGQRLLAMQARVDSNKIRTGDLSDEDWEYINDAVEAYSKADIIIDDTPGIGVMEMRNKCRRINQEKKIDLIAVDYMQIMGSDVGGENRQQEVSNLSRYLKQLAREMECPVVVLSQLNRSAEKRQGDTRPILSDLRESGAIEQDADVVMFLHREDYYKKPGEKKNNICEIIIAKQRMGETGSVYLTWLPSYTKFADYVKDPSKDSSFNAGGGAPQ